MCPFEPTHDQRFDALRPDQSEGPRDILPRLVEGDPLELLDRCARHLTSEALLLDLGRLHARSLAIVARRLHETNEEGIDEWLRDRVRDASNQLIHEEQYEERLGFPPPRAADPRTSFLMGTLGVEPALTRGVSVSFHRMEREARRTFFRAVVSGESIEGIALAEGGTRDSVLEILRGVIRSMSLSGFEERARSRTEPSDPGRETT